MSGIVVGNPDTYVAFGDVRNPETLLAIVGLFITLILVVRNVKGALFSGMVITAVIGFFTGMLHLDGFVSAPPEPIIFDLGLGGVFTHSLYTVLFSFLLVSIFDTILTMCCSA